MNKNYNPTNVKCFMTLTMDSCLPEISATNPPPEKIKTSLSPFECDMNKIKPDFNGYDIVSFEGKLTNFETVNSYEFHFQI